MLSNLQRGFARDIVLASHCMICGVFDYVDAIPMLYTKLYDPSVPPELQWAIFNTIKALTSEPYVLFNMAESFTKILRNWQLECLEYVLSEKN